MNLTTQFATMLSMIGMGSLFGMMFDTYQRFLNRPKRNRLIVFFNDLLFWMIQALLIFYSLFLVNDGELRFYIFIALLCGFAAYQGLIKGIYLRLLEILITAVISLSGFLKNSFLLLVYKPALGLIHFLIFTIVFLGRGIFTLVKFVFKVLLFIINKLILKLLINIFLIVWKLLPKGLKKNVEKLYNRTAGFFKGTQNFFVKWLHKFQKKKK